MVLGIATISLKVRFKGFLTDPATVNCHSVSEAALLAAGAKLYARPVKIKAMVIIAAILAIKVFSI